MKTLFLLVLATASLQVWAECYPAEKSSEIANLPQEAKFPFRWIGKYSKMGMSFDIDLIASEDGFLTLKVDGRPMDSMGGKITDVCVNGKELLLKHKGRLGDIKVTLKEDSNIDISARMGAMTLRSAPYGETTAAAPTIPATPPAATKGSKTTSKSGNGRATVSTPPTPVPQASR